MTSRKGFTLMEIVVVFIIIGLGAVMALYNFFPSVELTRAQSATNNLLAIAAAQSKYYEDYGVYCTKTTGNVSNCGNTGNANLKANLNLGIAGNDQFSYSCTTVAATVPYNCNANDAIDSLTFNPNALVPPSPVSCTGSGFNQITYCPVYCVGPANSCPF